MIMQQCMIHGKMVDAAVAVTMLLEDVEHLKAENRKLKAKLAQVIEERDELQIACLDWQDIADSLSVDR